MKITGNYKWNKKRRELVPADKSSQLFSIRFGEVDGYFFINYKTSDKRKHSLHTHYILHELEDGEDAVIFMYSASGFAFRMPHGKRGEVVTIKQLIKK